MTCKNAHSAVMLYHEKRLKPIKSISLHRHLKKCGDCRELFLEMDMLRNLEITEAPAIFEKSVMSRIMELPALSPPPVRTASFHNYVLPVLALALAAVLAVLYNTDLMAANYAAVELPVADVWNRVNHMAHYVSQTGQNLINNFIDTISINFVFIIAIAMAMTAIGIDMGKQASSIDMRKHTEA